jgi:hypothetical protein
MYRRLVSLLKPAKSDASSDKAAQAVDGYDNRGYFDYSDYGTCFRGGTKLTVDLEQEYDISQISIFGANYQDCKKLDVRVGNDADESLNPYCTQDVDADRSWDSPVAPTSFSCAAGARTGRYVTVEKADGSQLSLCELSVFSDFEADQPYVTPPKLCAMEGNDCECYGDVMFGRLWKWTSRKQSLGTISCTQANFDNNKPWQ